jgi:PIN domain nuclease of toxin-antitoxin system
MKYLLDTHVALWLFEGNEKLSNNARSIIANSDNEIFISIISAWEVAIKISINKLNFDGGSEAFLLAIEDNNIDLLSIDGDYVKAVEKLPFIHRDPFDRIIIASALTEGYTIITDDENIQKYDVLWAW